MFDYYTHVNSMTEDKLHDEIRMIYDRLFVTNPASPVYDQLQGMLEMAQDALGDQHASRHSNPESDGVINIGEIDSVVNEIDYSKQELLDILVTSYIKKSPKGNTQ